ncbi:MAG: hypothetical protein ACE5I2_05925, partial [Anaerolineae bacterium]
MKSGKKMSTGRMSHMQRLIFVPLILILAVGALGAFGMVATVTAATQTSRAVPSEMEVSWVLHSVSEMDHRATSPRLQLTPTSTIQVLATPTITPTLLEGAEILPPLVGGQVYTDTVADFTLTYPEGWLGISNPYTNQRYALIHPEDLLLIFVDKTWEVDPAIQKDLLEGEGELAFEELLAREDFDDFYYDVNEAGTPVVIDGQLARRFTFTSRITQNQPIRIKAVLLFLMHAQDLHVIWAFGSP